MRGARAALSLRILEDRTVPSLLIVTSAADDGSAGTLRAVLASAHSGDTITFAHKLAGQTITLLQGQLNVTQSVNIVGLGATQLTISGNSASRIFDLGSNEHVKITGLTLTQGLATDGGAILNAGNLTVAQDDFSANVAQGLASGGLFGDEGGRGGAIENQSGATLAVVSSTFSNNQAIGGPDNGVAFGGGIYNEAGTVNVSNSAFTGNQALATSLGLGTTPATLLGSYAITLEDVAGGGGIWNDGGALSLANSTLTNNQANGVTDTSFGATFIGSALGGAVGTGAFFTNSMPGLKIANSTLSGNLALASASYFSFFGFPFYFPAGIARGGAVEAFAGDVSVTGSNLSGNFAESGTTTELGAKAFGPGKGAAGGALDDEVNLSDFAVPLPLTLPSLDIEVTTLGANVAQSNAPGKGSVITPSADGGALAAARVNIQLRNSTVTGNQALGAPGTNASYYVFGGYTANGGYATGGGIEALQGSLTICGSTVKNNAVAGGGGAAQTSGYGGGLI
ncbi:MAG TPA: hypothetical protein VFA18_10975, partial [Gemmataceae bacterium]|nr:hypothetical protein [Gemmataceae bacterium]